ncbi:MAG TPA: rhomboid family intramembrane serine protease [Gammaproteobacteria bacterium]|nr:rhomboid family intramembrane serine protease [Gammaproteobacteria bacterium]
MQLVAPLLISNYLAGLPELSQGQWWRLLTPIFLHFGLLHLVFNMLWLWDLGDVLERVQGSRWLLLFVIFIGIASNLAQYVYAGPLFGGMSGVVYGLLGYLWLRGYLDPHFPLRPNKSVVYLMLGWFVLAWTGLLGPIANMAHTIGLTGGGILALITVKWPMQRIKSDRW